MRGVADPDDLAPHPSLPDDSRLWAALQHASGGTWGGCVFDVDEIVQNAGSGAGSIGRLEIRVRKESWGGGFTPIPPLRGYFPREGGRGLEADYREGDGQGG